MYITEFYENATAGYGLGDSPLYDAETDDRGTVFRACQKEHGRCTGYVYADCGDGPKRTGWVFEKKCKYEDANEYYIQRVWVSLYDSPPTVTHHPLYF